MSVTQTAGRSLQKGFRCQWDHTTGQLGPHHCTHEQLSIASLHKHFTQTLYEHVKDNKAQENTNIAIWQYLYT